MALQVQDLALSLLWLWLDPWPQELLHAMGSTQKKTKPNQKKKSPIRKVKIGYYHFIDEQTKSGLALRGSQLIT